MLQWVTSRFRGTLWAQSSNERTIDASAGQVWSHYKKNWPRITHGKFWVTYLYHARTSAKLTWPTFRSTKDSLCICTSLGLSLGSFLFRNLLYQKDDFRSIKTKDVMAQEAAPIAGIVVRNGKKEKKKEMPHQGFPSCPQPQYWLDA